MRVAPSKSSALVDDIPQTGCQTIAMGAMVLEGLDGQPAYVTGAGRFQIIRIEE